MNENESIAELRRKGFLALTLGGWTITRYGDHTHPEETAHLILSGELTLTMNGQSNTYRAGERCDVPANTVHNTVMGPRGCRYLIGER